MIFASLLFYRSEPKPTWSAPDDNEPEAPAVPEVPAFGSGKSGKSKGGKSSKTPKAEKVGTVKSWKSKAGQSSGKSGKTKGSGMFARWEGGSGGGVAFNKDGSSQSDVAKNLENGSSRSRSLRIGAAVAFIVGALACL